MKRNGTHIGEDIAVMVGTVVVLETIKWAFGFTTALIVACVALIACVAFLYHAGRKSA